MYTRLLTHYWKSLFRKTAWTGTKLSLDIISVLLGAYLVLHCLALGLFADIIFEKMHPEKSAVEVANGYLMAAFVFMFSLRFFLQTFPHVRTRPYLHLPLSRGGLVHFFQLFTLTNFHNIYPLFLFVPFWLKNIVGDYPAAAVLCWIGGIFSVLVCSNYLVIALRVLIGQKLLWGFAAFFGAAGFYALDKVLGWHYLDAVSAAVFDQLLGAYGGGMLLGLVAVAGGLYTGVFTALKRSVYLDAHGDRAIRTGAAGDDRFAFLESYGLIGRLMHLEIRMLWRKKRTRQVVFTSLLLAGLGFMYVLTPMYADNLVIQGFGFIILTGALVLNYGQFMFSWESRYFDGFLTRDIDFRDMVKAKLVFLQISCAVFFALTVPVFIAFARGQLVLYLGFLCFNVGFSSVLVLLMATFNSKRIYLSQSSFANWEGTSIHHFILVLPLVLGPALLLYLLDDRLVIVAILGGGGVVSALAQKLWIDLLARRLARRKYRMADGFRGNR